MLITITSRISVAPVERPTGLASVDGLTGGKLELAGGIRLEPNGSIGFDDLRLAGAHAQARIDGAATPERAYVAATMTIPSLARADDRLTGRAEIHARVTGTLERPDATPGTRPHH